MTLSGQSEPRQPFLRAPAEVIGLIVVLVGAHAARVLIWPDSSAVLIRLYALFPSRYSRTFLEGHFPPADPGNIFDRAVPFVSYQFLHANWSHVLINSVWLLAFGPVVARRFGPLLFLVFFLICGVAGGIAHVILYWGNDVPVIGASGAISGLMAAAFRMLLPTSDRRLAPIFSPRILLWSGLWIGLNAVAALTGFGTGGEVQLIAWDVHLGGYLAGLLLAGPFDFMGGRPATGEVPT